MAGALAVFCLLSLESEKVRVGDRRRRRRGAACLTRDRKNT